MYKLIIEDDENKTTVVPLIRDEISIGRKEGNTIRLTERNVSRRHARILRQNGALYIEDLLSYTGTKVNGEKIQGKIVITDGDRIQIGDYQLSIKQDKAEVKAPGGTGAATVPMASPVAPTVQNAALQGSSLPTVQHPVVEPPKAAAKPARLIVVSRNFANQEFPLDKAAMIIGRTDDNDIVLNHRSISRHHAKIVREGDHYHVVDQQSANGVRVNGESFPKVELRARDKIDLGHVRLIFVPQGQEIDVKDYIVDLESGKSPVTAIALALMLLAVVGGGAYFFLSRGPTVDPESEAAKLLVDVESDLQAKRWSDAIDKTSRIISNPAVPTKNKEVAQAKKTRAEQEAKSKQVYERFATAAGGGNYDDALKAYRDIPEDSVYRQIAREDYDKIFPLFVEAHLKSAEDARNNGNCAEFQNQLQIILAVDRNHPKALAAKEARCGERVASTEPAVKPEKPERVEKPEKVEKPERGEKPEKQPRGKKPKETEPETPPDKPAPTPAPTSETPADVDQRLSDAQTEYVNGNYQRAIDMAKSVQKGSPVRAWRIIGSAACNIKDLRLVNDAYRKLDAPGRQYLLYVCQRNGITSTGSQFKLAEQ